MNMHKRVTLILAGGQSRRMGTSKTFLPRRDQLMIEHLVFISQKVSEHTIIISHKNDVLKLNKLFIQNKNISVLQDEQQFKGFGPLAGIYSGMKHIKAEWYFVLANDMPNINISFLKGLQQCTLTHSESDIIIPIDNGRMHPLAGVYRNQKNEIYEYLKEGNKKMTTFIDSRSTYKILEQEWGEWTNQGNIFFNMNTPADLTAWEKNMDR
ncbi:molybdenum cofactor guanylyltransferase [Chengkuizengella sediminis]|uniref:molybdenum cofactor guanylyltransferase n=1 Tax=Chengkuizengella sediminis TaxID=1885917 RepID=UPI00138A2551|nr:molybdenum cofactor guanylyltransferase [Chengkuizengella sediminis]NDI36145.1 molybdenum cofactor guanylyltransferase [Chengkuizengella sediminis]